LQPELVFAITIASGLFLTTILLPFQLDAIYADESETNTKQGLSQENIGSGESFNTNCGQNSVDGSSSIDCRSLPIGEPPVGGPPGSQFVATYANCRDISVSGTQEQLLCDVTDPPGLRGTMDCLHLFGSTASCTFNTDQGDHFVAVCEAPEIDAPFPTTECRRITLLVG
jgi:hypothetical protein